jgi:ornithine cyclodeaminase/alanine dehydrogenase-like protein (mu-crystallin family)
VLVLSAADVRALLDMPGCIAAVEEALISVSNGEVLLPLRMMVQPADHGSVLALMPVHRGGDRRAYGLKSIAVFPGNSVRGLDPHQGTVTLFDGDSGIPLAVLNAEPVTAIRTAAATAVATRALARADGRPAAIIGSGHQARSHVEALRVIGYGDRIRIASRTPTNAQRLAGETGAIACTTVEEAVRGAGVVVTVTSSSDPVVRREWLEPGVHVNAIGACFPDARELDSATMAEGVLFTDRLESLHGEAGDYLIPLAEGVLAADRPAVELGSVLAGHHPGRQSDDELTVFKSLGIAVEDLAAAEYVVRRAHETGAGSSVDF